MRRRMLPVGEDLPFSFQLQSPISTSRIFKSPVVAGSYLALAGIGGSVSSQKLLLEFRSGQAASVLPADGYIALLVPDAGTLLHHVGSLSDINPLRDPPVCRHSAAMRYAPVSSLPEVPVVQPALGRINGACVPPPR